MQRVASEGVRITELTALLRESRVEAVPERAHDSTPDPAQLLQAERKMVQQQARDEGYAQGLAGAGEEIAKRIAAAERRVADAHSAELERLRTASERLEVMLREVPDAVLELEQRFEPVVVEAVYAAVLRLIGDVAAQGGLLEQVCRQALSEYRQRPVVMRVAPSDMAQVQSLTDGNAVRVEVDALLMPGQCRLETHKGLYDAGVDVRLDALKQALLRSLGNSEMACP